MRFDSGPEVFVRVNRNYVLTEYVLNENDCTCLAPICMQWATERTRNTVLNETCWISFSTTFFAISMEWTGIAWQRRLCPSFMPSTFSYPSFFCFKINLKKKSWSGRKIGAVGDDKQLFFLLGLSVLLLVTWLIYLFHTKQKKKD